MMMEQETAYFFMERNHHLESQVLGGQANKKEAEQVNALSDKNFFFELSEYVQGVD